MEHHQLPKGTIRVECQGASTIRLDFLCDFQDGLKEIEPADLVRLQREMIDFGFNSPLNVWKEDVGNVVKFWVLDGDKRTTALRALREAGWTIPPLPISFVEAMDAAHAKRKCLGLAGTYGKTNADRVAEYVKLNELDCGSLDSLVFPDVDMDDVLQELAPPPSADDDEKKKVEFEAGEGGKGKAPEDEQHLVIVSCDSEAEQKKLFEEFTARGLTCKVTG
jgi:hypothetical protein